MPTRDSAPLGAPCWMDLFSSDPDRAKDFYGQLFGWTAESAGEEYGGYVNFSKNGLPVAGMMKNDGTSGAPDGWTIYLSTSDAQATVDAAATSGGQVIVPAMEVMQLGSMAVLADSSGAGVGVWQPGLHKGYGIVGEAGAPVWNELHTRDFASAVKFYEQVFNWTTKVESDTDDFRYTTMEHNGETFAGIMDAGRFLPEGVPSYWSVYFGSDDVDAALAKVEQLGGKIIQPAEDTPYGRLAQAADPTGALFKLSSLPS